ncbi:MAG: hypothetical protein Q9182_005387 [Xanthomendoza sp. 2 TL-2023]
MTFNVGKALVLFFVPVGVVLLDDDEEEEEEEEEEEDEVVDVEPRIGGDGGEEEGEEVVDVEPRIGGDGSKEEGEEVVDVEPRIGGGGSKEEGVEEEVLEDIGEVLEVEGMIEGAEDVGESDEVGEEVKAGDVEEMAALEVEELKLSCLLVFNLSENVRPRGYLVLVGDLIEQEQKVRDRDLTSGEKSVSADTVVEMYDTLAPTFVARLVGDDVDSEEVDVDVEEEELEEVDDVEEELEVVDVVEELRDEVDEDKVDEIEDVEDDVVEDPGLLHPLRHPAPQPHRPSGRGGEDDGVDEADDVDEDELDEDEVGEDEVGEDELDEDELDEDELDEDEVDKTEEVGEDVEEDPGLLHPLRHPAPQ